MGTFDGRAPAHRSQESPCAAAFEALESRLLLDAAPTVYDQYLLELINRGRANPAAEAARYGVALNEGLAPGTISEDPKQPVAFNASLIQAAQGHSQWMLDNNTFDHQGAGGSWPWDRAQAAGYPCGFVGENLAWQGTPGTIDDMTQWTAQSHENLYVDAGITGRGHRINQLNPDWKEIGTGVLRGPFVYQGKTYDSLMVTEDFGDCGGLSLLTGVVYDDALVLADDFYTPGEGLGGVTVTAVRRGDGAEFSGQTWPSGGYTLPLATGTYDIYAAGDQAVTLYLGSAAIGSQNVKVDAASDFEPPPLQNWQGAADHRWGNAANWSACITTGPQTTVVFDSFAPHQPALGQDRAVNGVHFETAGWTVGGHGHTLTVGTDGINSDGGGLNTFEPMVALDDSCTFRALDGNTIDLDGGLDGRGYALTKDGAGTLEMSYANSLAALDLQGGTVRLQAGGSGTLTTATGVTVASGATLGGSGTINGDVAINSGGTLAPGASVGTLTINNDLTFADGGNKWVAELFGADADRVTVTGDLTLGDDTALEFVFGAADPFQASTYTLASYATLVGEFSSVTSLGAYSTGVDYGTGTSDAITIELLAGLLAGDATLDRTVNLDDFARLRNNFGTGDTWAKADFNGDDTVNLDDFAILRNNYGSLAPEPATLAILAMGGGMAVGGPDALPLAAVEPAALTDSPAIRPGGEAALLAEEPAHAAETEAPAGRAPFQHDDDFQAALAVQSSFAKVSVFATATPDRSEDKSAIRPLPSPPSPRLRRTSGSRLKVAQHAGLPSGSAAPKQSATDIDLAATGSLLDPLALPALNVRL